MSRKFSILVAFCTVLFGAILAGYWDMLDSEKLRSVRDEASRSVAELTGTRSDGEPAGAASRLSPLSSSPDPKASERQASVSAPGVSSPQGVDAAPMPTASGGAPGMREASLPEGGSRPVPRPALPSFDILRVEPDGSAVLAGRAAPNAEVKLIDGDRTIGAAKASPGGDFAIVLDDRLPAGDHQIRIEASASDGARSVSEETAIVSIPRPGDPGELLAMVEAPNRPSRIITLPSAEPAADGVATAQNGGAAPKAGASAASVASATNPADPSAAPSTPSAAPSPFAVEAVEIENGNVYVAGRAPGSEPVRIYIDNKLIGEDAKRANGRFLVTAKVPLAIGNHQIRADMIKPGGAVASRVEVPFARPVGEAISAIASNEAADGNHGMSTASGPAPETADAKPSVTVSAAPAGSASGNEARALAEGGTPLASSSEPGKDVAAMQSPGEASATPPPSDAAEAGRQVATDDAGAVETIRQPALESVHARVLIRRGDTLWRISRQTYGVGHRYTVIYVANGDQIRNPNRIYPGQVFRLPKDEAKPGPTALN